MDRHLPILVAGLPRAGTTWVANVLARSPDAWLVYEPDNNKNSPAAAAALCRLGRFPVLAAGQAAPAPYQRLWQTALGAGLRHPRGVGRAVGALRGHPAEWRLERAAVGVPDPRVALAGTVALAARCFPSAAPAGHRPVAKSVHAPLAVEWITDAFTPRVVVVLRHPANVLASWLALDLPDADRRLDEHPAVRRRYIAPWQLPEPGAERLERIAWHLGLLIAALEDAADRHPDWCVVVHEDLCRGPEVGFRQLFRQLDVPWSPEVKAFLADSDRPGEGYAVARRASEQPQRWRSRLTSTQVRTLARVLGSFPLRRWSPAAWLD